MRRTIYKLGNNPKDFTRKPVNGKNLDEIITKVKSEFPNINNWHKNSIIENEVESLIGENKDFSIIVPL